MQRPSSEDAREAVPAEDAGVVASRCLTPEETLAYLRATAVQASTSHSPTSPPLDPHRVQEHLDDCDGCRLVLAEAVRAASAVNADSAPMGAFRMLADGQSLLGRFQIRCFIARGGMGEVYEAFDNVLGERVALKTLLPTALDDDRAIARLAAEVRLARKVTHANVCRILEFGVYRQGGAPAAELPFLTMEFLTGEALSHRISSRGRLPPATVVKLVADMTAGLAAIHAAGVVHRDFKGENVFLVANAEGEERAVIMDFGLARGFGDQPGSRSSSATAGTPDYMAPEQIEGKPPTPAFDVYALGVVIFEMLTGQKPFASNSPYMAALGRLQRPAPAPSSLAGGLDPAWDSIVGRCLEREPQRRFARVEEVTSALQVALAGPTSPARFLGSRHLRVATMVVLATGALVVGGQLFGREQPRPPAPSAGVEPEPTRAATSPRPPAPVTITRSPPPAATLSPPIAVRSRRQKGGERRAPSASAQALLEEAQSLMLEGEVPRACQLGKRAAISRPALPAVQLFLGKCHIRLGDAATAGQHYRRYLELAPDAPNAVFIRGILEGAR